MFGMDLQVKDMAIQYTSQKLAHQMGFIIRGMLEDNYITNNCDSRKFSICFACAYP